jgi:hypothetical protein
MIREVNVMGGLKLFTTKNARTREINKLQKEGCNYFVCYKQGNKFALQFSKAKKSYVNKYGQKGVYVEGNK